ncbi:hypothetical protein [Streptomyces chromofuscus]|uniref:hypothetical protein n=1 Tax=Streptomyces chromofuscus TaxID=42881 RepID=UPI0016720704|nr:hypothetical protein [Streptomyces chromofuscus]
MAEVEERCAAAGVPVKRVTWQRVLEEAANTGRLGEYPYDELARLWLELFPVFFADADIDGRLLDPPRSIAELAESDLMARLHGADIRGMRAVSPLATGWLEMAGHTLLQDAVVRPLVAEGHVVLSESLGVKNVIKSLFMAEFCAPEEGAALSAVRSHVQEYFGRALAPELGIYLKEDPAAVLAAKGAESIGVFDNFRAFGGDPGTTFLQLQSSCLEVFEEFAWTHGWVTVDVRDTDPSGQERAAEAMAEAILTAARHGSAPIDRPGGKSVARQ